MPRSSTASIGERNRTAAFDRDEAFARVGDFAAAFDFGAAVTMVVDLAAGLVVDRPFDASEGLRADRASGLVLARFLEAGADFGFGVGRVMSGRSNRL